MLEDRQADGGCVPDSHLVGGEGRGHDLAPGCVKGPKGLEPRLPVGRFPETGRRLPEPLAKSPGEGVGRLIAGVHSDVGDALPSSVRQPCRGAPQTRQLDITMQGDAEGRLELPVEMEFGKRRDAADRLQTQIAVEVPVDVIQHLQHPGPVVVERRRHHPHPLWRSQGGGLGRRLLDRSCGFRMAVGGAGRRNRMRNGRL
ncbi:hypothetical protein D3C87_1386140 [compost metagenome]